MALKVQVAVVGGGIAGLAATRACELKGISVRLFEKNKSLTCLGGGIALFAHGQRVLKALDLEPGLAQVCDSMRHYLAYSDETLLMKDSLDEFTESVNGSVYSYVRHELLDLIVQAISPENMSLGTAVNQVSQDTHCAYVHLDNGEIVEADIVIAADGIRSRILDINTALQYCGYGFWGGVLQGEECVDLPPHTLCVTFGVGKLCWVLTLPQSRQWWYIAHRLPEQAICWGEDKLSQLRDLCRGWTSMTDRILSAPQTLENFAVPVHENISCYNWSNGRVVGIGDAAHAMGPTTGMGVSSALVDAISLVQCISQYSKPADAIEEFSIQRKPVIQALHDLEQESANIKLTDDPNISHARDSKIKRSTASELFDSSKPIILSNHDLLEQFENRYP